MRPPTLLITTLFPSLIAAGTQQPLLNPSPAPSTIPQPLLGFGTWNLKISEQNTSDVVSFAIQTGYRQIDCAAAYGNEKAVGRGIADGLKKANLTRGDIWVTSKLWSSDHGNATVVETALNKTLDDLGLDYLDLYLIHWPFGMNQETKKVELDYVETWKSFLTLPKSRVLNLGISNFSPAQLQDLITETGVKPAVHQMELHPYLQQRDWVSTHKVLGIAVTAYSPLGNSNPIYPNSSTPTRPLPPPLLKNKVLAKIAAEKNCTVAQVALAWGIERGTSVIPKSASEAHIVENFEAEEKCKLGWKEQGRLRYVGRRWLTRFSNPSERVGIKLFEGLDGA